MITCEDVGKGIIVFDPNKNKWEPCRDRHLSAVDAFTKMGYLEKNEVGTDIPAWRWPLKYIRVLDGY